MITLQKNGIKKRVATGFSWKCLLFGCLYPLARGDARGAAIQFALAFLTAGLSWLIVPFTYNRSYIQKLVQEGYIPTNPKSERYLFRKFDWVIDRGVVVSDQVTPNPRPTPKPRPKTIGKITPLDNANDLLNQIDKATD